MEPKNLTSASNPPAALDYTSYYPSKSGLSKMVQQFKAPITRRAIPPGFLARTDRFDVDQMVTDLEKHPDQEGLLSHLLGVSDLTPKTYNRSAENPNSLYNWLPAVEKALESSDTELKSPATKVLRLPIELAQFIRMEYQDTSQEDKDLFNRFIFDQFGLEDDKTYFIKTGTFSSKFQFANAKCSEPREIGEYFQVINNFAMTVGASQSVDLVMREYIEDVEQNPRTFIKSQTTKL